MDRSRLRLDHGRRFPMRVKRPRAGAEIDDQQLSKLSVNLCNSLINSRLRADRKIWSAKWEAKYRESPGSLSPGSRPRPSLSEFPYFCAVIYTASRRVAGVSAPAFVERI